MYAGWLVCGTGDPLSEPEMLDEILNNARAYAYAEQADICWLHECLECPEAQVVLPGGPDYVSPIEDPAPWYDPDNPDSWGFLGVIGLGVDGSESSTLQTTVTMALSGGGVIGPPYHGPRTLTVRALIIAKDECSLQFGLNHMRDICARDMVPPGDPMSCVGDDLTFFDCCPCVCDDETPGGPCWASSYLELETFPPCGGGPGLGAWPSSYGELAFGGSPDPELFPTWVSLYSDLPTGPVDAVCWPDNYRVLTSGPECTNDDTGTVLLWWPETYTELIAGPPADDPQWCDWPNVYRELRNGPPSWSCCVEACVIPYLRQYHRVRVTEGPTVLRHPVMNSGGALAEIELVIVAADPVEQTLPTRLGTFDWHDPVDVEEPLTMAAVEVPDPFAPAVSLSGVALLTAPVRPLAGPTVTEWSRVEWSVPSPAWGNVLSWTSPIIEVRAFEEAAGEVRVGVWAGEHYVDGWYFPFIPAHTAIVIDGPHRSTYTTNGTRRPLNTFVRGWEGQLASYPRLAHGTYRLTIDQQRGADVALRATMHTAAIGAGG